MDPKNRGRAGGPLQGLMLALLLVFLVIGALWMFLQRTWWFPTLASEHGADLDFMFAITLAVTGVLFILLQLILGYFSVRFGERAGERAQYSVNRRLELRFAIAAAVIILGVDVMLAAIGESAWLKAYGGAPPDSLTVEATGEQFVWNFRYPGKDSQFGRTDPSLVSSSTNPLGLDRDDPAARDDIVMSNQLHLPVGRPVRIRLRAKDVIHSFFLANFRVKQDAVPGMAIEIWFVPNKPGDYEIACAQLCGLGHYRMRGFLKVESQEEFEKWLGEQGG